MLVYQRVFDLPRVKSVGSRMSTSVQRINAVWTDGKAWPFRTAEAVGVLEDARRTRGPRRAMFFFCNLQSWQVELKWKKTKAPHLKGIHCC